MQLYQRCITSRTYKCEIQDVGLSISKIKKKDIDKKRLDAGYSGAFDDNGAGQLENQLDCWLAGLAGNVPYLFNKYEKLVSEEYEEYSFNRSVFYRIKSFSPNK
jgi:cell division protein FtsI/penicillin-binding protein 2